MHTFKFPIGTKYTPIGKDYECTVADQYTTRNAKGDICKIRYCATHVRCGQTLHDDDVVEPTIARALHNATN